VIHFASSNNIPLCFEKPTEEEMQKLVEQGVELFFSAEYPWKIPIPVEMKYAFNAHPTLLPEGKGMTPLPELILRRSIYAGITLHKLNNDFDTGDILLQKSMFLDDDETFDSLSKKVFEQTPSLLFTLLDDLEHYYENSQQQGEGSYWPPITKAQQSLDWKLSTAQIEIKLRAFGSLGIYANINGKACVITLATVKIYQHNYNAGQVILDDNQNISVAIIDGELCIPKNSLFWV
jgi:methionyl-tRNA formyltransferase